MIFLALEELNKSIIEETTGNITKVYLTEPAFDRLVYRELGIYDNKIPSSCFLTTLSGRIEVIKDYSETIDRLENKIIEIKQQLENLRSK